MCSKIICIIDTFIFDIYRQLTPYYYRVYITIQTACYISYGITIIIITSLYINQIQDNNIIIVY